MRKVRTLLFVLMLAGFASCADEANEIFDQSDATVLQNGGNGSGEDGDDPIPPGCGC